ncbi:HAMP domain-containing histidine kinase [Chitinophaga agrisoli]|uniref:histidine kinase n=1 Tax=Chitinophaga agrisoli TaxID=2607653 RepID=A0A5B2VJB7_9BACT|nr:HAMP domain-containing sensor histidine kinase [Chitinophaga agrisoli]KAA2239045.1 HAMP domain-containing histidine kinase [Chitinophaga agrisoli]
MRYKLSIPVTVSLIMLTILVITAFQAYWLRKNYRDEQRLFTTRTNLLFRATVFRLQAYHMKLDTNIRIRMDEREGMIGMANVLEEKMRHADAASGTKRTMFIRFNDAGVPPGSPPLQRAPGDRRPLKDSLDIQYRRAKAPGEDRFDYLVNVDSLHDTLAVKDITRRYQLALAREKIPVAFQIQAFPADTSQRRIGPFPDDLENNTVTLGFATPISYRVNFENNTWYLLRRISQPILISAFLLGVTGLSFLLLYRNLQQQQKLAQQKNDFISNMTHELKTPIATVSVAIEALRNFQVLDDPQATHEYLEISANEMQRLSLLVDKVLKLSMFENREIALNKETFDLRALARSVMASMKLQFEQRQATTALKTTGSNFIINADKLHMSSVLYNLLDNALKYSLNNPDILVHIIDHKQYIELRVSDNGIGIAGEYRNRIFEKFFRVPSSGNRHNIKGYGLGLSYVSHILQRHMGFIEVSSELGKGSIFSVKLPFAEAPVVYYDNGRRIGSKNNII